MSATEGVASSSPCEAAIAAAGRASPVAVDAVLHACPELATQVVWTTGDGLRQPESTWAPALHTRFEELFRLIDTNAVDLKLQCS